MKLFAKYNRVNIVAIIATFIAGGIAFYFVLYHILLRQLDGTLRSEQQEIEEYVAAHGQLPEFQNTHRQWITAQQTANPEQGRKFGETILHDDRDGDDDVIRQFTFSIKAGATFYNITVNRSEAESEDLRKSIIAVTLAMIGFILLVNYFVNRQLINKLLAPFYHTIATIKNHRVAAQAPLQLPKERVEEFTLLNDSLNEMTARIYREYQALKSFTENASHEMQTPLAIINGRIEVLLQNEALNKPAVQQVLAIEEATKKLARLHKSLLLLAKLENRQFITDAQIDMQAVIETKLEEWGDLATNRGLMVNTRYEKIVVPFNHHLADILVNNLLGNALRYTPQGKDIDIDLNGSWLRISNTAAAGGLDGERVFRRFYKAQGSSEEGTGLGLAIVKEICSVAGFNASYAFSGHKHIFTIYFNTKTANA
jgi:signal transduction histidine kinase